MSADDGRKLRKKSARGTSHVKVAYIPAQLPSNEHLVQLTRAAQNGGDKYTPTVRTKMKRYAHLAAYERATVHAILDEAFVCHVGFVGADGHPVVMPNAYVRIGEELYMHGSISSRMLKTLKGAPGVCVTITLTDGLQVARSVFHTSINYRSVTIFGEPRAVTDPDEKRAALDAIVDHIIPGRNAEARGPSAPELTATAVMAVPLTEVSAKVSAGHPQDDEKDYQLPIWAGELPFDPWHQKAPVDDPRLTPGIPVPPSIAQYKRMTAVVKPDF